MGVLFALFIYFAGIAILGRIVLKRIPSFGLTLANLLLFVIGATIGMFACVNLFVYFIYSIRHFLTRNIIDIIQSGEGFLVFFLLRLGLL
jgi:hypothetical protein